ncbi:Tagatose-6-phosphate kinase [Planctomycetes bacterium Pan216]|uniref:Tagatose-6-phosphate kinase n=1 Tax=Kolteria novifilia TaxID=2527975 RepID=A0A518B5M0_9BACT|nr:Tagatose-6-phosphate kinase [Planctomycetes bacterium Pan216]
MILAAGLTPAWQQILCLDDLELGEVNRASKATWCASGKVINVGIGAHHLDGNVKVLALVGSWSGDALAEELTALGIPTHLIWTDVPTRVCTTLIEQSGPRITELVENARPIENEAITQFVEAYAKEQEGAKAVVLSGSLPPGAPKTIYRDLIAKTSAPVVLDARGPELKEALSTRPFVVKPNKQELEATVGRPLETENELVAAMRELVEQGPEWVVITQGGKSVYAASRDRVFTCTPPKVAVVNAIACGDCFAAGLACAIGRGRTMEQSIPFAVAAAAENARMLLPGRLERRRVDILAETIAISPFSP